MREQPLATFKKAVVFLGWEYSDAAIQTALDKSSFKKLKAQEEEKGFNERLPKQKSFFRSGQVKEWENHLTPAQIDNIITQNRAILEELGYQDLIEI